MARPIVALIALGPQDGAEIADYLDRRGYDVRPATSDWAAASLMAAPGLDVAIVGDGLGPSLPIDLLRRHAGGSGPSFIVLSSRGELIEKVLALELGAADVVASPVNPRELAARVAGLVARRGRGARELVELENSTVDLKSALVMHRSGEEEQLSAGQVALLRYFLASPRKVLSRDDIMAAAPAESADAFDRSIDSRIVRLRRKLDTESIVTIRGSGYRFDPPGQR